MATITGVFDALQTFGQTLVPATVKKSFGLDNVPDKVNRTDLPCLIVVEPSENAINLLSLAMMGNALQVSIAAEQLLLYDEHTTKPLMKVFRGAFTALDAYMAALKANPYLTGSATPAHHSTLKMNPWWGVITYGDTGYWGYSFKYQFILNL